MTGKLLKKIATLTPILALMLVVLGPAATGLNQALADELRFKDGRVWEGTILDEKENLIKFRMEVGGIVQIHWVSRDDLKRVVRDEEMSDDAATTDGKTNQSRSKRPSELDPDVPTLVFIPMEEMVGTYMNRQPLEEAMEEAADLGDNAIAVLVFDSGGGMLREIQPMSDIIEDYKQKIRVVAWIKSAISAAAMTSLAIPEIYFMPEGNFGACTGFYGDGGSYKEVSGEELEAVLLMMERISERGGYNPLIMRKMQVNWFTLSADIDPDGVVTWYPDDRGEHIVSPEGKILTFNSETATKFGFAKGIAGTEEELADLLQLTEWQRADFGEDIMEDWHDDVQTAESAVPKLLTQLQRAMGEAGSGNERTRRRALGEARRYHGQLQNWFNRVEIVCLMYGIDENALREIDRQIRELARRG
jgi:membrane-bound ClpP family serine protease